jgi:hypothetical protein
MKHLPLIILTLLTTFSRPLDLLESPSTLFRAVGEMPTKMRALRPTNGVGFFHVEEW